MEDLKTNKEKLSDNVETLLDHIEGFLKTFYRLTVIRITEKAVNISAGIVNAVAILIFSFFIVLFGGFALAWWLGDLLNSRAAGFLLTAAFFGVIMTVIILISKKILFPLFRDKILNKFYDK